ncbi:MAG: hypothetical protein JF613_08035, partial [Acidobacteria bacterium]|nr:hypothetical protein [Acidobacteriota bacterium]
MLNGAERDANQREEHGLPDDQSAYHPAWRAERHANADLAGPLRHGVRQHAKNANRGQQQRDGREQGQKKRVEARLRDRSSDDLLQRANIGDRHVRIGCIHRASRRGGNRTRRHGGPENDRYTLHGPLTIRQIQLRRLALVEACLLHVADDSDDLSTGARRS